MQELDDKDGRENIGAGLAEKTSVFGPSLDMSGELEANEDLILYGQFKGKINLKNHNLIVERRAKIEADILAHDVTIFGNVHGNIQASGKVTIAAEAQMKGDITASKISITDGAHFKGTIKMEEGSKG